MGTVHMKEEKGRVREERGGGEGEREREERGRERGREMG